MIQNSKCKDPELGFSLENKGSIQKSNVAGWQQGSWKQNTCGFPTGAEDMSMRVGDAPGGL